MLPPRVALTRFLLLGTVVVAARASVAPEPIFSNDVTHAALERLARADPSEEDLLVREALRRGLHQDDVVRRRIAANLDFVEAAADRRSIEAGLLASDPVVRRRLVQRLQFLHERPAFEEGRASHRRDPAGDGAAGERMTQPLRLEHLFFRSRPYGPDAGAAAHTAFERLRRGETTFSQARNEADPLPFSVAEPTTPASLGRYLGPEIAARVADAPIGQWLAPMNSVFGFHVLRVEPQPDSP